jgi:prephenate dehydrogenase
MAAEVVGLPMTIRTGLLPRMPRIVVIGAGLLGGSLLAALQQHRTRYGGSHHLTAVSSADTGDALRTLDWCDAVFGHGQLAEACLGADLIVLCTPLSAIHTQIDAIAACHDCLAPGAIVTDVGSTKVAICRHGNAAFPDQGADSVRFVGGHPMAGSEKSGLTAADPLLYQSALWVLCPPPDLSPERLETLTAVVRAAGARVALLDPAVHDAAVARISHVPQVLASALAGWAGADEGSAEVALALAAGGFRDMTRLALSPWEIWRDILATNSVPIADGLHALSERLALLAIAARAWAADTDGMPTLPSDALPPAAELAFREAFASGKAFRERFRMPKKGIVHDLTELVVRLEDRPGQLQALFAPLASAGINVQDLEILKVREGESGTILLGFATPDDAGRASLMITAAGFSVTSR